MTAVERDADRGEELRALLARASFSELDARARAIALLDDGSARELLGPFDGIESPWLSRQDLVPQSDDGACVLRGGIQGRQVVVAAIEQRFVGGGVGEVSGAKISAAIDLATADRSPDRPTAVLLLLETGGVRLQEANLGLAAVAEICASVLAFRRERPVVGVIAGPMGCFGGMGIVAGLCSDLVMTAGGRLGVSGPEVIEAEAGMEEFDAHDRELIWHVYGGASRRGYGHVDTLVDDDVSAVRDAVMMPVTRDRHQGHRSQDLGALRQRLSERFASTAVKSSDRTAKGLASGGAPMSRGVAWMAALADGGVDQVVPSVLHGTARLGRDTCSVLAVRPDPGSPYRRSRHGEVGMREALALADEVRQITSIDARRPPSDKRPIVALVDVPSHAYGRLEETLALHEYLACTVDAYAHARMLGHPVIALVVGHAISGGFLAHGLQANQVLALDDDDVEIHAMHRSAAARITRRTLAQLDDLAVDVPPMSYWVRDWAALGMCADLVAVTDADTPSADDVVAVSTALVRAVTRARQVPFDLSGRRIVDGAASARLGSHDVYQRMAEQW